VKLQTAIEVLQTRSVCVYTHTHTYTNYSSKGNATEDVWEAGPKQNIWTWEAGKNLALLSPSLAADTVHVNDNAHNLVVAAAGWWCRRCLLPVVTTSLPLHVRVVGWEHRIALGASSQPMWCLGIYGVPPQVGKYTGGGLESTRSYIWFLTGLAQKQTKGNSRYHTTTTNTVCT
jgi:hypothetical protein